MTVGNYVNRKSGNVVKVVEVDEKTKTLIYEGADGKTHVTSWSSFRKSYKAEESADADTTTEEKQPESVESAGSDEVKETDKPEKSEKKSDAPTPKKERKKREKSDINTIDITEDVFKRHNLEYKRTKAGGGIGLFIDGTKVLDIWRRSDKIRVYVSSENPNFKTMNKSLIEKMHDNPSKTAKLNKSFYVNIPNIEAVILHYAKEVK